MMIDFKCPACNEIHKANVEILLMNLSKGNISVFVCPENDQDVTLTFELKPEIKPTFGAAEIRKAAILEKVRDAKWTCEERQLAFEGKTDDDEQGSKAEDA